MTKCPRCGVDGPHVCNLPLAGRIRALAEELSEPWFGGRRTLKEHIKEVLAIEALEGRADYLRTDLREDEDWSERACEVADALAERKP